MKIKYMWIPFVAALFVTLPLRLYQTRFLIDRKTGFFISGEYTFTLLVGILAVFVLLLIIMCLGCKNVPKQYVLKKNIFTGLLSLAVGIFLLLQSSNGLLSYVTNSAGIQTFVMSASDAIAAVGFIFIAVCSFSEKNYFRNASLVALFTTIWGCIRLVLTFLHYTNIVSNSQNMLDITSIIFILLFLFSHAKLVAEIENEKTAKHTFAFGMSAILTICVYNVPVLLMYAYSGEHPSFTEILPNVTDLLIACFALGILIEITSRSGKAGLPEINTEEPTLPLYNKRLTEAQKHSDMEKPKAQYFDSLVYDDEQPEEKPVISVPQKPVPSPEEPPISKTPAVPEPSVPTSLNRPAVVQPKKTEVPLELDEIDKIIAEISAKDNK